MDVRPRGRKLPFELLADESIGENVGFLSGSQSAAITEELADDGASIILEKKRKRKRKSKGFKLKDAGEGSMPLLPFDLESPPARFWDPGLGPIVLKILK